MGRYFLRAFAAHFRSGRTLFLLTLLGIALGVASVLSIQILNRNALGAFEGSVRAVSGDADLAVLPRAGALAEETYARVLAVSGVEAAWPALRVDVGLVGERDAFLEIVATDLFAAARIPWEGGELPRVDVAEALSRPGWAAVTPELAREKGWSEGSTFAVGLGTRRTTLRVGALVDFRRLTPLASRRLVVMDLSQAQDALGARGELSEVDVRAAAGTPIDMLRERIAAAVPEAEVVTPEQRRARASGLLGAFRLNLTALSLISLFVGTFLVYAATRAALLRRREEFGLLRSIGATPAQVLGAILAEVAVLGAAGTAIGIPLGWVVARAGVATVSATLTNFYMLEAIERLTLPPWTFALAAAIGAAGVLAGSLVPAVDASRAEPKRLLATREPDDRLGARAGLLAAAGGALAIAGGAVALVAGDRWRPAGFVVAAALALAIPLLAPWLVRSVSRRLAVRSFSYAYGVRVLGERIGTSAVAAAALAVAVTMLFGITIMIGSFRRTVAIWVGETLRADVYVTTDSWPRARRDASIDPSIEREIESMPGVAAVDRLRQIEVESAGRRIVLGGADLDRERAPHRVSLLTGDPGEAMRRVREEGAALVSEPFARKAALAVGDSLVVASPAGETSFPIAGIFRDYSSEAGGALVDLAALDRAFGPRPVTNLALYLEDGASPERFLSALRSRFPDANLRARSNRELREEVFAIFDRTFAVTRLLQGMSLVIAACGIALTLLILARERISDLALYRALGASRAQIFRVFLGKGIGIALHGLVLGAVGGVGLAFVLVLLVNRAWFGWTIAMDWPWGATARQAATILLVAVVASVYPALRASRTPATELSREG